MRKPSFLEDDSARVPFAVIGIFLIMISTIVSLNLSRLDLNMAKTMSSGKEVSAPDTALQYARADIARAINYAGMEALKKLGETPVIKPDNTSRYYNGTDGDPDEFNKNWARALINDTLARYIESNYMYDVFVHDGFSVNVDPLSKPERITLKPIKMKLKRALDPPVLSPGNGRYGMGYGTYWIVSVPLRVHIKDMGMKSVLLSENITVETVITSRYPLLKDLTDEYGERANGTNAVMTETTAFSMAYTWGRGYLQYSKGIPLNIVNNSHLALIINGALLLDQGFVFNSADPMSIVEYGKETAYTLLGKKKKYQEISLENGSMRTDPENDAFNSTADPESAMQEYDGAKQYDYNATPITDYLNNGSRPGGSMVSRQISRIIEQVYSTTLATGVARQVTETEGRHDGYESDNGAEDWGEPDSMRQLGFIPAEPCVPGSLDGEIWEVRWMRKHSWRHYYVVYFPCGESVCSYLAYNEMTATDTRVDVVRITLQAKENSRVDILLDFANKRLSSRNDVERPYTKRDVEYMGSYKDPQLEEAYLQYETGIFDPNKISNLKNRGLNGDTDITTYTIDAPGWVSTEAQSAVDEITEEIRNDVHLDPDINYKTYPVPSEFLDAARNDLIMKIERNISRYVDKGRYYAGSLYGSTSAKAISVIREWYADEVKHQIQEKFTKGSDEINEKIRENFGDPDRIKQANRDATKLLSEGLNLPIGLTMTAYHVDEKGKVYPDEALEAWNESVTLSINQEPDYLYTANEDVELITLGVRSFNVFGPTGLPVLPTMEPWLATTNIWKIDVQGKINRFEVQDIDNEVHPDPIFGHVAQVYVREEDTIDDLLTGLPIGDNLPIKFSFTTGTFIIVPSGKFIGDDLGHVLEETNFDSDFKVNP